MFVAGLALPPVGDALDGSGIAVPVALVLGAGAAVLYARASGVRTFVTVLSPAPLIVLFLFLVVSPVHGLLLPSEAVGSAVAASGTSTPIVHIVLDELPLSTLTDAEGEIDGDAVPEHRGPGARLDVVPPRDDGRRPHGRCGARAAHRPAAAARRAADHP